MATSTKTKVTPLQDRLLVKRLEEGEIKRGGIIIPDTAKEKPQEAQVIAAGPGRISDDGTRIPMAVKAGDRILIGKYTGTEVKIDGEDLIIVREDDVLATIEA
ncbi:co-chaperone GroES [Nocardioides sp.]|uniref:co-chaperone GroES n=1 Tax=Nocardioides sp. TaxID=35761 RepID=UPI00286E597F|nr:co-chaperone GroES [Nocardioides sp.]